MSREQEANKASKSYAYWMCNLCLDEFCPKMTLECPQFRESLRTFSEGVRWADEHPKSMEHPKSVWHPASEEPSGKDWRIMCQDEDGGCWIDNRIDAMLLHNTWNEYAVTEAVVKWAYIDELIK